MESLGELAPAWPQLNQLLDEALSLPVSERALWLQALPQQHAQRRDTLARPLDVRNAIQTGDFLATLPKLDWLSGDAAQPHIARLYDAGVDDIGRPWLALEYA
jgi:hypothetical protein